MEFYITILDPPLLLSDDEYAYAVAESRHLLRLLGVENIDGDWEEASLREELATQLRGYFTIQK